MRRAFVLSAVLLAACGGGGASTFEPTPLDEFVADTTGYAYDLLWTGEVNGVDIHLLDVTSQTWRTAAEVDRTLWWHDVALALPGTGGAEPATVLISGGSNDQRIGPGSPDLDYLALFATLTGRPAVLIGQIPNQPLTVMGQGGPRSEDDLVAATWDRAMATGDPTWSAYFAMTRAAVRCLDAVQDYTAALGRPVGRFVVTGFSKRGATTWLVAAVDARVVAIAPGVFDFLNFGPQVRHHLDAYGAPAPALAPYEAFGLLDRIDDPAGAAVAHSDPYVYRARFTMPKLLVASTGDQFFLPDSARFYFGDLPGETLLRYVPNTDHGLAPPGGDPTEVLLGLAAWHATVRDRLVRPRLSWSLSGDRLTLTTQPAASAVTLWKATNPAARDFRLETLGALWEGTNVPPQGGGNTYVATVPPPAAGWTAFFLEATFGGQVYSTQVYVTPDTYPVW